MSETKVRIGIVGLGNMGSAHIAHISKVAGAELAACCDIVPEKAEKFGRQYNVPFFTDAGKMMDSGLLDAIIIAVPHYFHTPICVDAFAHNLHVLTEKPIAVHKNDALKMIRAHEAHPDKKFAAMFQLRLTPAVQKLRELIQRGELGSLTRVTWTATGWFRSQAYYDSGTWRATWKGEGGGVLLNQCPHHIDQFQWLFGMPKTVHAKCYIGKYHHIEVEDEVIADFEYENGMVAQFIASTSEAPGTLRVEIACDRGRVVMENGKIEFLRNEIPTMEFKNTTKTLFGIPPYWAIDVPVPADPGDNHLHMLENFVDAIQHDAPLVAPAEEGLNSVELANAMLFSSMKQRDVNLPLDGDAYEAMLHGLIENSQFIKDAGAKNTTVDMTKSFSKS